MVQSTMDGGIFFLNSNRAQFDFELTDSTQSPSYLSDQVQVMMRACMIFANISMSYDRSEEQEFKYKAYYDIDNTQLIV